MKKHDNNIDIAPLELVVADRIPTMLSYWDTNVVCRYANAAFLKWFGVTAKQLIGKLTMEQVMGTRYKQNIPYVHGVLAGKPQHFERAVIEHGSEGVLYADVRFFPHIDENGVVKGFIAHANDITEVMLLQQQVERSSETIKAQNKSLMNFANIVSHNLLAYANNLKGMLEMYEVAPDEKSRGEVFGYLKQISAGFKSSVDNLNEVVKAHNLSTVPMQAVNIHDYITHATEMLRPEITSTGAMILNYVNPTRYIDANPAYMESIVQNLIGNAIKYRHPERAPVIEISSFVVGPETVLSIKDNGLGIDLETHRPKLYGMYNTFHGNRDATGIGLFITKYQVDSMGGHIGLESAVGEGTEFRVYFRTQVG